jgi:hypothetical protein
MNGRLPLHYGLLPLSPPFPALRKACLPELPEVQLGAEHNVQVWTGA